MIRVNLLPHRAEKRKARQIQFAAFSGISLLLGIAAFVFVHMAIESQISYQQRRNDYLTAQIKILDSQIVEIEKLRAETEALLTRKTKVENLQTTRSDVVHLLDQMLKILPNGVYIKSLRQNGNRIDVNGAAQSNARISTLIRAIGNSTWLESPNLIEIHATGDGRTREFAFTMNFVLKKQEVTAP